MKSSMKLSLSLSLAATLAACGGGGGGTALVETPDLPALAQAAGSFSVQSLKLEDADVIASDALKSILYDEDTVAQELEYAVVTKAGNIIGVAANEIPQDVTFGANDAALANISFDDINYVLINGDVTASIDQTGHLSVILDGFDHERGPLGTQSMSGDAAATIEALDDTIKIGINTSLSGASGGCSGKNLFCGGTLTLTEMSSETLGFNNEYSMSNKQFVAGVYGNDAADAELAGKVNYVDQESVNPVFANVTFITGQK